MDHLSHHEIKLAAYSIWLERTKVYGEDSVDMADDDWFTAEKILREEEHRREFV